MIHRLLPPLILSFLSVVPLHADEVIARVRREKPSPTPRRFNAIPDRIGEILIDKHHHPHPKLWGLAKRVPAQDLPYDEVGSATFFNLVREFDLYARVGELDDTTRRRTLEYWQSWQDPETGRFHDPDRPDRVVNEKYVVGLIGALGGEPSVPWTTTSTSKKIETDVFLKRTKQDEDWARGGWSVGSHTGLMAVEIFRHIDGLPDGEAPDPQLAKDLERGMNQILAHQDPCTGLWGAPDADPMHRIGGTLKVIGRFYYALGLEVPHTRKLTDTLIDYQRTGTWFKHGQDSCVPRNVAEIMAYCLEADDYRRDDLLDAMALLAKDYEHWVTPEGHTLMHRDRPDTVGIQYTTIYGLGILGGYLHWEDCRLRNPLDGRARGGKRCRVELDDDGDVQLLSTDTDEVKAERIESTESTEVTDQEEIEKRK